MESLMEALKTPMHEDFEPSSEVVQEKDCDTLLLNLPGFRKEQLKVQFTPARILRISGSRPIGDNKWSHFRKEFPLSPSCDDRKISAKFESGILYIRLPKMIVPEEIQDKKLDTPEAPKPQLKPADERPPAPKNVQEQATDKIPQRDDPSKKTSAQNIPQKGLDKEKPEVPKEEKITEPMDGKTGSSADIKDRTSFASDKRLVDSVKAETDMMYKKATEIVDDIKKKIPSDKGEDDTVKAAGNMEKRATETAVDSKKKMSFPSDKSEYDGVKAADRMDKRAAAAVDGSAKTRVQNYKETAADVASKLKMPRRVMNVVLVAMLALVLGIYVTNFIRSCKIDVKCS